jgi:death on curing protein
MNHPFNDGNKRTGALTAILFLEQNDIQVDFSIKKYEDMVVDVAKGLKSKDEIAAFFRNGCSLRSRKR